MFRLVLGEGRSLIAQRNQIEDRAVALLKDLPDYQLLPSIPGIGPINALTILAEAGDLRRFGHHRQFLKFCGMHCPAGDCKAICRKGLGNYPVWHIPWPNQTFKIWKRPLAPHPVDGRSGCHSAADKQFPRQVRTLHRERPTQHPFAPQGVYRNRCEDGPYCSRDHKKRRTLSPLL